LDRAWNINVHKPLLLLLRITLPPLIEKKATMRRREEEVYSKLTQ